MVLKEKKCIWYLTHFFWRYLHIEMPKYCEHHQYQVSILHIFSVFGVNSKSQNTVFDYNTRKYEFWQIATNTQWQNNFSLKMCTMHHLKSLHQCTRVKCNKLATCGISKLQIQYSLFINYSLNIIQFQFRFYSSVQSIYNIGKKVLAQKNHTTTRTDT